MRCVESFGMVRKRAIDIPTCTQQVCLNTGYMSTHLTKYIGYVCYEITESTMRNYLSNLPDFHKWSLSLSLSLSLTVQLAA